MIVLKSRKTINQSVKMDRTVSVVYNTGAWKGGFQLRICTILSNQASGLGQHQFPQKMKACGNNKLIGLLPY